MAILNFIGFETGNNQELLEIIGTPKIGALADNFDVHSGSYSMFVSSDHADGYGGFNIGEVSGGLQIEMNRNRIFTKFYCYFKKLPASSTEFFAVKDVDGYIKNSLRVNNSGDLIIKGYSTTISDYGPTFKSYTSVFEENNWYRIEVQSVSNGNIEIRINGISFGIISLPSNNAYISKITVGNADDAVPDSSYAFSIDDIEITNDQFPNSGNIVSVSPIAIGHYDQWHGQVEDTQEPLDNLSLTALDGRKVSFISYIKDEFYLGDIKAIKVISYCKSSVGKNCKIKNFIRQNGVDYLDDAYTSISEDNYYPISNIYQINPDTGLVWTRNTLKQMQYGLLTSDDTDVAYCDYTILQINYS